MILLNRCCVSGPTWSYVSFIWNSFRWKGTVLQSKFYGHLRYFIDLIHCKEVNTTAAAFFHQKLMYNYFIIVVYVNQWDSWDTFIFYFIHITQSYVKMHILYYIVLNYRLLYSTIVTIERFILGFIWGSFYFFWELSNHL